MCEFCGANESPEWRRGPNGSNTLCNACGIKYAKRRRMSLGDTSEEKFWETPSSISISQGSIYKDIRASISQNYASCPQFIATSSSLRSENSLHDTKTLFEQLLLSPENQQSHRSNLESSHEQPSWNPKDALFPPISSSNLSEIGKEVSFEI
jgi:hypothetical protein